MKRVVVKLGGSVITKKNEGVAQVRKGVLDRLCAEIGRSIDESDIQAIIVHGAGPYGHVPAKLHALATGFSEESQVKGVVLTRRNMGELNQIVVDTLLEAGVDALAVQPSACAVLKEGRISQMALEPVRIMLENGFVPVCYGDVLMDEEAGFKILSGDQLSTYLALECGFDLVIMVGDFDGVFTGRPGESEKVPVVKADTIPLLRDKGSGAVDVTGGFRGKLMEMVDLAEKGVETRIISGLQDNYLYDTLTGKKEHGTLVTRR